MIRYRLLSCEAGNCDDLAGNTLSLTKYGSHARRRRRAAGRRESCVFDYRRVKSDRRTAA
jgi:hypothetical protein